MAKRKNIWIIDKENKGKVGTYGHFLVNTETGARLYRAIKKNRSTGIHHKTRTISVDLKTLKEAKDMGVKAVVISFTQSKDLFAVNIDTFFTEGVENFDDGDKAPQIRLGIEKFVDRRSDKL